MLGGKVGDVRLSVSGAPQFNSEDVLLFLDGDEVVGIGQGRFEIQMLLQNISYEQRSEEVENKLKW